MLISIKHEFCFLSQQKCGTTSIEKAIKKYCEIQLTGTKYGKHINYITYNNEWKPFLKSRFRKAKLKSICTTRHPISLLISWYTYKSRPGKEGKPDYTGNKKFSDWFSEHLESIKSKGLNNNFFLDESKRVGPDYIFPLEKIHLLESYMSKQIGKKIKFRRQNSSPKMHNIDELRKTAWDMQSLFPDCLEKHIAFYEELSAAYETNNNIGKIIIDRNFFNS